MTTTNKFRKIVSLMFGLFMVGLLMLSSCSSDDTKNIYSEENPLMTYLYKSGFNETTTNFINAGSYEFGYKFKPKVKGKINAITFKIPDNATDVRVTIWDADTQDILRTTVIPSVTANVEVRTEIEPLNLSADKNYLIIYNGNDWYTRQKTDGSATTYPIDAGNITITGYHYNSGTAQNFPVPTSNTYYAGDLSIVFQQVD